MMNFVQERDGPLKFFFLDILTLKDDNIFKGEKNVTAVT